MLTQLATVKSRLALPDTAYAAILTAALLAVSARFDTETNRTLARTENATHEFSPDDTEIIPACYPIESVTKFELKFTEAAGWQEQQPTPDHLIRQSCIISLSLRLGYWRSAIGYSTPAARVTYVGGYVLPGTTPAPGQTPLPADLENAAIEQVAFWFQSRDKLGLDTTWPHLGTYEKFAQLPFLIPVQQVLTRHRRCTL